MNNFRSPFIHSILSGSFDDQTSPQPRPEYRRPLPPEQSESFRGNLINHSTGVLHWLGSSLDKPGRAVRGVLGGHTDEAAAAIPFSDSLGLTDPGRAVSGRDLTNKIGITRRGDRGWLPWGLGLGTELATDPLTYATFGAHHALTPAGQGLKNIGVLQNKTRAQLLKGVDALEPALAASGKTASQIAHYRNQGQWIADQAMIDAAAKAGGTLEPGKALGGLIGFGSPLKRYPSVVMGTGPMAQRAAGFLDKGISAARYGNPVGRTLGSLLDYSANGATGALTQKAWRDFGIPAQDAAREANRANQYGVLQALEPVVKSGRWPETQVANAYYAVAEGTGTQMYDPALIQAIQEASGKAAATGPAQLQAGQKIGVKLKDLGDQYVGNYMARQATPTDLRSLQLAKANQFPTTSGANIHREDVLRDIPGGTAQLNEWSVNPGLSGPARTLKADQVQRQLKKEMWLGHVAQHGTPTTKDVGRALDAKAEALTGRLGVLSPSHAEDKIPLFNPNVVGVLGSRGEKHARTTASAHAALGAIASAAQPMSSLGGAGVPLSQTLRALGMITYSAKPKAGIQMQGAMPELWKRLAPKGAGPVDSYLVGKLKPMRTALNNYGLPIDLHNEIVKQHAKWSMPEELSGLSSLFDKFTGAFKNFTYPLFPASHVRNAASAAVNNLQGGTPLSAYGKQLQVMTGRGRHNFAGFPGMPTGLNPHQQLAWLRGEQFASAKMYTPQGLNAELPGGILGAISGGKRITPALPGSTIPGATGSVLGDTAALARQTAHDQLTQASQALPGAARLAASGHPLQAAGSVFPMRGVGAAAEDFPALGAARKVSSNIEDFFRGANWFGNVEKGMAPSQAGREIDRLHFDYDRLTQFEKRAMRRVFPFYCMPIDHEILTQAGWKTYDKIEVGDPVLSYDHENGTLSWEPLEDVAVFDYDGELWTIKRSRSKHSFAFTPDHRWPVITNKSFVKGKHYGGERKILRAHDLNSTHKIPLTANYVGKESVLTPRQAAILGWVVSDGYRRWRGNHCEMLVYQSPKKYLEEIVSLLGTSPRKPHPETGVVTVPVSLEDTRDLCVYYQSDDDLPEIAASLSREAAESMWDAMFKAEGWAVPDTGQQGFAQDIEKNPMVLEAFQILSILTGRSANLNGRGAYVGKLKSLGVKEGFGKIRYRGKIWCPKTKHGCWVVRHDGSTILTGNTFMRRNLPLQLENATTRPGMLNAQLRPMEPQDPNQYTPEHLASGVAVPLGDEQDGTQRFLSQTGLPLEEAFERMKLKDGLPDLRGTAFSYMGMLNPLLKAPAEQLFDRQFHTGRKLSDLKTPGVVQKIGEQLGEENPQLLTQFLMNTPLTRFISSADKLTDERKGVLPKLANMATGLRVTDVDMEKARAIEARKALEEIMSRSPHISQYTDFYVRPGDAQNLTPNEVEQMRMFTEMQKKARAYAEQQRRNPQRIGVQR